MQKLAMTALFSMLAACAGTRDGIELVSIGDGLVFQLLPPASFGDHVVLTQLATISYMQQDQPQSTQLLFYSEIDATQVNVAVLLPDGTRLFSLSYDGDTLQSDGNSELPGRLDPHYLLADMQIALWPHEEVRQSLASHNRCFASGSCQLDEAADQRQRSLHSQRGALIDVRYGGSPHYRFTTDYQHHQRQYQLTIETLEFEVLQATTGEVSP